MLFMLRIKNNTKLVEETLTSYRNNKNLLCLSKNFTMKTIYDKILGLFFCGKILNIEIAQIVFFILHLNFS